MASQDVKMQLNKGRALIKIVILPRVETKFVELRVRTSKYKFRKSPWYGEEVPNKSSSDYL
jgi:hypothetical protein